MSRLLAPGTHGFDDVLVGDRVETAAETVTAGMIDRFADLTGDRFEIHMSRDGAARHGFPDRVAHGLLVLSVVDGLKNRTPAQFRAVASLRWEWDFQKPVIVGDTIRASIEVIEKRATRRPDRGILALSFEARNQRDEVVQVGRNLLMTRR